MRLLVIAITTVVLSVIMASGAVVFGQTATPSPSPTTTTTVSPTQSATNTPTPTGQVQGATVPSGAPATGRG